MADIKDGTVVEDGGFRWIRKGSDWINIGQSSPDPVNLLQDIPFVDPSLSQEEALRKLPQIREGNVATESFKRGLLDLAEGAGQSTLEVGEQLGRFNKSFMDGDQFLQGAAQEFTESRIPGRRQFEHEFGGLPGSTGFRVAGEMAPLAAIPAPKSTSATRNMLEAIGLGGLIGGTQFQETPGNRQGQAATGAAFGVLGGTPAAKQAVALLPGGLTKNIPAPIFGRNAIAKRVASRLDDPQSRISRRLSDETGIGTSLGGETGSRTILSFEQTARSESGAAGEVVEKFDRRQAREIARSFTRLAQRMAGRKTGSTKLSKDVSSAFESQVKEVRDIRRDNWTDTMKEASRLSDNRPFIKTEKLQRKITQLIDEASDPLDPQPQLIEGLQQELKILQEANNGVLTPEDAQTLLVKYTDSASGTGALFRDIETSKSRIFAQGLKSSLNDDLDAVVEGIDDANKLAAKKVIEARDQYKVDSDALNTMRDSVLGSLFGRKAKPTAESVISRIKRLKGDDIKQVANILELENPALLADVRRGLIEDAVKAARRVDAPKGQVQVDVRKLINELPTSDQMAALFRNPEEAQAVKKAALQLQRVLRNMLGEGRITGTTQLGKEIGANAVSHDPIFIARTALGFLTPRLLGQLLFTPRGRQILTTLEKPALNINTRVSAAMLSTLSDLINPEMKLEVPEALLDEQETE